MVYSSLLLQRPLYIASTPYTCPLLAMADLAEFCEFVIANLFEVAPSSPSQQQRQGIDTPPYTPPPESEASTSTAAATAAQRKEPPALVEFIVSHSLVAVLRVRRCRSPYSLEITRASHEDADAQQQCTFIFNSIY